MEAASGVRKIPVVMDDREPRHIMTPVFASFDSVSLSVERLSVGDYLVDDFLLVERKTYSDLVCSIIDGRLFDQAVRLSQADRPAALVVEISAGQLQNTSMRWEALQGALVAITLFIGVPVWPSRSPEETVRTFLYAVRQHRAANLDALPRHARRPKRKAALQSYILQGLPGIGPKRAKALIERFGSVAAVFKADDAALVDVQGFGPDVVRKIRNAIEEQRAVYSR
ncbi:MAG TPA: ERCC4 domain-containing protein [Steroidobacteraceae bacterium]|nr:ERCC4 domain-containing protein [Steroidobacteraceae bacterium]